MPWLAIAKAFAVAVDVAFTEAAVGAGIALILFLGALSLIKYKEKNTFDFLVVGRLAKEKQVLNIVRAFSTIKNIEYARLIIIGDGPERSHLETLTRSLKLENSVKFLIHLMKWSKKLKSMSFHQYSWNSEVGTALISLICWPQRHLVVNVGFWNCIITTEKNCGAWISN